MAFFLLRFVLAAPVWMTPPPLRTCKPGFIVWGSSDHSTTYEMSRSVVIQSLLLSRPYIPSRVTMSARADKKAFLFIRARFGRSETNAYGAFSAMKVVWPSRDDEMTRIAFFEVITVIQTPHLLRNDSQLRYATYCGRWSKVYNPVNFVVSLLRMRFTTK